MIQQSASGRHPGEIPSGVRAGGYRMVYVLYNLSRGRRTLHLIRRLDGTTAAAAADAPVLFPIMNGGSGGGRHAEEKTRDLKRRYPSRYQQQIERDRLVPWCLISLLLDHTASQSGMVGCQKPLVYTTTTIPPPPSVKFHPKADKSPSDVDLLIQ